MGKHKKKKIMKPYVAATIAALVTIAVIAFALFVMPQVLYRLNNDVESAFTTGSTTAPEASTAAPDETTAPPENTTQSNETTAVPENTETVSSVTALEFPLLLEGGKLKIDKIFQYDGINPDCNNQEGKNIATVTVTNVSDTYLESAALSVTLDSGEVLKFAVTDLPAGKTALAFSAENASAGKDTVYVDVACQAVFNAEASMNEERITVSVDGTKITLRNNTSEAIKNIVVYCRAALGDQYFGGITYRYTVNNLPANGTAEVDAVECFLGLAEVVRIAINE